ncbi:hypothetical protein GGR50DRAFT_451472 [Xylaria sp. CBS 124048]|nr:hypothetical protein GGR50DRAFT_451472 [Xylaria sp. CBS 124048]
MVANAVFDGCVVAVAGDLGSIVWKPKNIQKWVQSRGGRFSHTFNDEVTHLLSSQEEFDGKTETIQKALGNVNTTIVTHEWLVQSIRAESRLDTSPYRLVTQVPKDWEEPQEMSVESACTDGYVIEELWHIYSDPTTSRPYRASLIRRVKGTRLVKDTRLLLVWESNEQPHRYQFTIRATFRGSDRVSCYRLPNDAVLSTQAIAFFKNSFQQLMGIPWDEHDSNDEVELESSREPSHDDSVVESELTKHLANFTIRAGGSKRPRDEDDANVTLEVIPEEAMDIGSDAEHENDHVQRGHAYEDAPPAKKSRRGSGSMVHHHEPEPEHGPFAVLGGNPNISSHGPVNGPNIQAGWIKQVVQNEESPAASKHVKKRGHAYDDAPPAKKSRRGSGSMVLHHEPEPEPEHGPFAVLGGNPDISAHGPVSEPNIQASPVDQAAHYEESLMDFDGECASSSDPDLDPDSKPSPPPDVRYIAAEVFDETNKGIVNVYDNQAYLIDTVMPRRRIQIKQRVLFARETVEMYQGYAEEYQLDLEKALESQDAGEIEDNEYLIRITKSSLVDENKVLKAAEKVEAEQERLDTREALLAMHRLGL